MNDLILNFTYHRSEILRYLKFRFPNKSTADLCDAISTGYEKLLLDAAKPQPTLVPNWATLRYLSHLATIDQHRKMKRIVNTDFLSENAPLSKIVDDGNTLLIKKQIYESVVDEIVNLRPRLRRIMLLKYGIQEVDDTTSHSEIWAFKNQPIPKSRGIATLLGSTEASIRGDVYEAKIELKRRLCA